MEIGTVICPICTHYSHARLSAHRVMPGSKCTRCGALLDAAVKMKYAIHHDPNCHRQTPSVVAGRDFLPESYPGDYSGDGADAEPDIPFKS